MADSFVKKLDSVEFSFYNNIEAKRIGSVEINSALVYDTSKVAIAGGLADPKLGASPGSTEACPVCSSDSSTCQGHLGYIPLAVPVFNPFTIDLVYKLLKAKCSFCHRLKILNEKADSLKLKKKLCKRGKLIDAQAIESLLSKKILSDSSDFSKNLELLETLLTEKAIIENIAEESSNSGNSEQFSSLLKLDNEINSQFRKSFSGNCPHCKQKQPKITKENDNKIIRLALKEK